MLIKVRYLILLLFLTVYVAFSCTKNEFTSIEWELDSIDTVSRVYYPYGDYVAENRIKVTEYAPLGIPHQSAAAYGEYAIFVTKGRSAFHLYNLKKKQVLYKLEPKNVGGSIYHCNQCTFGIDKYDSSDVFPLLYISQRAKTNGRCFIEVYRILPVYDYSISDFSSFNIELVQIISLPAMTYENSLGNANCTIDMKDKVMYTYSRNNIPTEDNYGQCKITQFAIPEIHKETVVFEDSDIISSFMIDCSAVNMQGGCIKDGMLYIGQGSVSSGHIYLNIIDLRKKELTTRINLNEYRVNWEPEGCFFYDGCVMLAHTSAISRIDIK